MINVLSYVGMSMQSEVCLWTLLGLICSIFDVTLFKVWQMSMPEELSLPVQRMLRTMISGIMLVQFFTIYVYIASYIVLLYPVFLEERPTLLLPWLLLMAIRKLLCELTSLALGLGTCVLLGPARSPCIKFVVIKVVSIMPSFYMWMLIYSYYHVLKVASAFKTFPAALPSNDIDYGLELALRRRRAKSLLGEDQLRRRLISNCYNNHSDIINNKSRTKSRITHATDTDNENIEFNECKSSDSNQTVTGTLICYEDELPNDVITPRNTDRILEQFGMMMLRICTYLNKEVNISDSSIMLNMHSESFELKHKALHCSTIPPANADTPPLVASSSNKKAAYLRNYPDIFMKKPDIHLPSRYDYDVVNCLSSRRKSHVKDDIIDKIYHLSPDSVISNESLNVLNEKISNSSIISNYKRNTDEHLISVSQNTQENTDKGENDLEQTALANFSSVPSSAESLQSILNEIACQRSLCEKLFKER
ncbi:hypothetical protein ACJJTC_004073 [Scirpophaga incertulas]